MNPHDKEFALTTAATWRLGQDNYMFTSFLGDVKWRSDGRAERLKLGRKWVKHNLQEINLVKST